MKEHRKLAAIMFTDIVGYTAMMSKDEQKALRILQKSRDLLKSLIKKYNGEWLQAIGDGTLSSFASVVDAVNCALEVQRSLKSDPELSLRIGIHIGDVVLGEDEIYGDGVNVASRLETLAEPGGICISGQVFSEIRNKPDIEAVFLGEKTLKNVDLPLKIYALTVEEPPASMAKPYPSEERPPEAKPMPFKKRAWLYIGAVILLILIMAGGLYLFTLPKEAEAIDSLAVLPLENLSGDPEQEYFADGMTEALISELSQIRALRVISRTSVMQYKKARMPLPEIARELNVDAVVEGTVMRAGDKVRITAQLIRAVPERHLWAQTFDRPLGDVLALHIEVAQAIAREIKITVTPEEQERLERVRPVNPEAYQAYLRGRHYWNRRTEEGLNKAIEYFEQAIEADPEYALAYSGIADCYNNLGDWNYIAPKEAYPKAKTAAKKALKIDARLGEAHTSLAWVSFAHDWDWTAAEGGFKRAIELNPNYATAHQWYAEYLIIMRRFNEALAEIKRAQELDPLSLIIHIAFARVYHVLERYEEAMEQCKKAIELDPNFGPIHINIGNIHAVKGDYKEAIPAYQTAIKLIEGFSFVYGYLGWTYAMSDERDKAEKILHELKEKKKQRYVSSSSIATIYAGLDENDKAFDWLDKAFEESDYNLLHVTYFYQYDNLRQDPRFKALLNKLGLDK